MPFTNGQGPISDGRHRTPAVFPTMRQTRGSETAAELVAVVGSGAGGSEETPHGSPAPRGA